MPVAACGNWRVQFLARSLLDGDVLVDGKNGRVLRAYAGYQARFPMARGSGTLFVGPWTVPIMAALALLSFAVFFDRRRPGRSANLDILMLLALGISLLPFALGEIGFSTPIATAALALLLARLIGLVLRPGQPAGPLSPWLSQRGLLAGTVLLMAGRAAFTALVSGGSDVGYLSVFGAQAILDGFPVYSGRPGDLDAYGPATHAAYVPFAAIFPLSGGVARGGDEAARAASITFDALTAVALYAIGRRLRPAPGGHALGAALAFAWAANPLGFYQVAAATNDGLVGLLVALAVLLVLSPAGRGVASGLAAAAKWVPIVLAPLFAAGTRALRREDLLMFTFGFVVAVGVVTLPLMPAGGPREIYDVALGGLTTIDSPFSVWGLWGLPGWTRLLALGCAGLFAVMTAFAPRERPPEVVAGLAAAVIIAVQLALPYWSYAYVSWFLPCALIAMLGAATRPPGAAAPPPARHPQVAR